MEQSIARVRHLVGEVTVPGELAAAEQHVLLGAVAQGASRIANTPAGIGPLVGVLRQLGVHIEPHAREVRIAGQGLRGLRAPPGPLELSALGPIRPALLGVMAAQAGPLTARFPLGPAEERLCACLRAMGARISHADGTTTVDGSAGLAGAELDAAELPSAARLGLALAALAATGSTVLCAPEAPRSHLERLLRGRGLAVECRRDERAGRLRLELAPGQVVKPADVHIGGDLALAYPFMIVALASRRSRLQCRSLNVRPETRGLLDLLRQMGAPIEIAAGPGETVDIAVSCAKGLKGTRVAGERTARILPQAGLVAVLATQCAGEFVLRDLQPLRAGGVDRVAHLYHLLKDLGAHVAEYEQGLVIQGGTALGGCRLDCLGDPQLALACGAAGALAHGETTVAGIECLEGVFPDFLATLDMLRG